MDQSASSGVTDSPKKGPTLSTSTSSFEALDPHDPNLSRLATKMFEKTNDYISHELNTSLEDYKLLEQMNRATITKYADMNQIAENLATSSTELKQKLDNLVDYHIRIVRFQNAFIKILFPQMPYLVEIDEIEKTCDELELAAYKLDAYTIKLETKFNNLIKRK